MKIKVEVKKGNKTIEIEREVNSDENLDDVFLELANWTIDSI